MIKESDIVSTYQDFITVIDGLPSGTKITVSKEWCENHGLMVDEAMVKSWGRNFARDYINHNCKREKVSPTQGTASHKSSNNLSHYIKK